MLSEKGTLEWFCYMQGPDRWRCILQVSFVGLTEEAAREQATKDGYSDKVAVVKTSFKANSKVRATSTWQSIRILL